VVSDWHELGFKSKQSREANLSNRFPESGNTREVGWGTWFWTVIERLWPLWSNLETGSAQK